MESNNPLDFIKALQEAAKIKPFFRLPGDWPDLIRMTRDKESEGTVRWRGTFYKSILHKRSPTELSLAISWFEQVLSSKPDVPLGTTRFRKLLKLTCYGDYQIDGFPDAKDLELYALLAVLLINEGRIAASVAECSQATDPAWFAENKAQIGEIFVVCWKLREAYVAGEKKGRVANNEKGGKARNKKLIPYRISIIDRYDSGERKGEWKNLGHASKVIYAEIKAKKVPLEHIPSELIVERWIRDHRQGIKFELENPGEFMI